MGHGVREIPLLRLSVRSLILMVAAALAAFFAVPARAQGSLQDLVGTYSLTDRDVEGEWCANVPMDVQALGQFEVTAIDDNSVTVTMGGADSLEFPFDASARTFRYDVEQAGYKMSITGQFVRGRDNVALAMVWSWQPQLDCVASLTGSKSAPDIGGEGGDYTTEDDTDWGWLENPTVLALLALLMALTAAGVAFKRRPLDSPIISAEPEPEPDPARFGDTLIAPEQAYVEGQAPPPDVPDHVWEELGHVPVSRLLGPWQWHDGSRVSLYQDASGGGRMQSSEGRHGHWSQLNDGSIMFRWAATGGTQGSGRWTWEKLRPSSDGKSLVGESFQPRIDPDDPYQKMIHDHPKQVKVKKLPSKK